MNRPLNEPYPVTAKAVFSARRNKLVRHPWRRGYPNNKRLAAAVEAVKP